MLAGPKEAMNRPHDVHVMPVTSTVAASSSGFRVFMPPWGVAVLVINEGNST